MSYKLHLPDLMEWLERKDIVGSLPSGPPFPMGRKDKNKIRLANHLLPLMHKAVKYIFDSGSDQDEAAVTAVRDTAVAMMEAGLFHLPFPVIWIEDPFDENEGASRNYYLCVEDQGAKTIAVYFFQRLPRAAPDMPRYCAHVNRAIIDYSDPTDLFTIEATQRADPLQAKTYGEAIYSIKKFLVWLATDDYVREKVEGQPFKPSLPKKYRQYEHLIIRAPVEMDERAPGSGAGQGTGRKRRKHLVAGYIWGKHTRPLEEQRWVKPFFRGSQEVGEVTHSHRVVRT